ncbi:MAG TPA: calcium/sodium antiporter [Paracoccus sp. (in: a-proteobacteria)]|uniref:calcium/sodium antiporter n=1 Tax=uncultured Paracoccus sp. TaxID=189685 RepID=UPI00261A6D4B|nr:calcium/sodium antiporter [uncultured Paracoccus sp.]HMQ42102.1 calcium/sodium antiporter [Paracoccus sp. (in: a-proteobacteria)]HMR37831.1 calcium/sodium antiporter [Paracoccus sp. (in: a-proteobacteria)]
MTADLLLILGGLALLVVGGDFLVRGAVALALRLGIAPVIVGLTVLAFGTSAPELIVSVAAALGGQPGIALGNVVGSNIANVLLILGATAVIAPVLSSDAELKRSWLWAVGAELLLIALCFAGPLMWWHGAILLAALAVLLSGQLRRARQGKGEAPELEVGAAGPRKIALWLVIGLVALPIGAKILVAGASDIARSFGISEAVIGLTLVAIGTSLPELAASLASALRGRADMALGNVIGSNIFNILAIMGITAFFGPLPVPAEMLRVDLWFMLATTLLVGPFLIRHIAIGRLTGTALLSVYAAYTLWLLA